MQKELQKHARFVEKDQNLITSTCSPVIQTIKNTSVPDFFCKTKKK
jgi:hypothetical protein